MKKVTLILLFIFMLILAACGGAGEEPAAEPESGGEAAEPTAETAEEPAAEEAEESADRPTITLISNPWSASELNVVVARILLSEEMGYPVEVISLDENAQWAALAAGDAHASLEVWPSGHAENIAEYIESQGVVEDGGPLGPEGKIGWYTPSYMVEQHPELTTWEGFTSAETAALYATAETGDQGQFLAGDPSWVQYDADIMNNLGINFEVVTAGSEEAILAQLDAAYSREDPVLFYFWTPHSVHAQYDLTEVQLPDYSDECYAGAETGGVDCDYPADVLFKIFWSGLQDEAPDAYQLLKNMNYSTEDQIQMIAAVELDGKTVEEAARDWLAANEATWQAWIP
jgi:glycine betaine/proline transport system substrate-binding protein